MTLELLEVKAGMGASLEIPLDVALTTRIDDEAAKAVLAATDGNVGIVYPPVDADNE